MSRQTLEERLLDSWYNGAAVQWWQWALLPIYAFAFYMKVFLYALNVLKPRRVPVPLIVVGNISVGGTGKTPLTMALYEYFSRAGYNVGVVSKGYGREGTDIVKVTSETAVELCGDEPAMMAKSGIQPLYVGKDRFATAMHMLSDCSLDCILTDDGLQDLSLYRDFEIVVIDGERLLGNEKILPAGPLRESIKRLDKVDLLLVNGSQKFPNALNFSIKAMAWKCIGDTQGQPDLTRQCHAVAGIGNPGRFFRGLEHSGIHIIKHAYSDHHKFCKEDLIFGSTAPILMTEKDAVKCEGMELNNAWYLPVRAELNSDIFQVVDTWLPAK